MVYCTFDENTHGHVHTHTHAAQEASERDTEPCAVWSKKAGKESEIEKEGEGETGESACKSEHASARESDRESKSEVARMRESEGDRVSQETETCQGRRVCPDNKRTGNCA